MELDAYMEGIVMGLSLFIVRLGSLFWCRWRGRRIWWLHFVRGEGENMKKEDGIRIDSSMDLS